MTSLRDLPLDLIALGIFFLVVVVNMLGGKRREGAERQKERVRRNMVRAAWRIEK